MKKLKIAILSDSPTIPTGYRNQATQIARYMQEKGHEIHYLANAYMGSDIQEMTLQGGEKINYPMYGHQGNNPYFKETMSSILKRVNADRFIILLDTFMLYPWILEKDLSPAKTFFWYPSDGGGGMPMGCERVLQKINVPVAMARFGQKQVKDYYGINSRHIPHCVNSKEFKPLSPEEKAKIKASYNLTGKFVIGVVARNQPRKNLDRTIKAMRHVADRIPNAILFLHLDPNDPAQQMFNIPALIRRYNLENRVVFTGMNAFQGFPQSRMNEVYNAMDCFLLTTSGEGFGVPIIEAMSCGVPVVATNYTTTPELVLQHNAGLGIRLSGTTETTAKDFFDKDTKEYDKEVLNGTMTGSWMVERGFCDIKHAATQIKFLYDNPEIAKKMGENGRKAVLQHYDYEVVGKQWEELLHEE